MQLKETSFFDATTEQCNRLPTEIPIGYRLLVHSYLFIDYVYFTTTV